MLACNHPERTIAVYLECGLFNAVWVRDCRSGAITPVGATVVGTNPTGSINLDIAITLDGKFLYTPNAGTGWVSTFSIQLDGTLLNVGSIDGLNAASGLNGIAAL